MGNGFDWKSVKGGSTPVESFEAKGPDTTGGDRVRTDAPKADAPGSLAINPVTGLALETPDGAPLTLVDNESAEREAAERDAAVRHQREQFKPVDTSSIGVEEATPPKFEIEEASPHKILNGVDLTPIADVHIDDILRMALERKASDIHLTVGLPPMIRLDGELTPLPFPALAPRDTRRLIYDTLTNEQLEKYETKHELDFGYTVKDAARFRFNVYMQRGSVAGALRAIPTKIPPFESLGLPQIIREVCKRTSGLILVTGPTGSGKTTTIASMIDDINEHRAAHILTIEDPIEYLHRHKKCMINQRELNIDTFTLHDALRAVLREDPDIVLVGELRDLETIEAALTLSETGHLVFGTLHTRNAPATVDRIVDVFPTDQQDQIRVLLGNTLEGVIAQQLLPKMGGGRLAAVEVMLGTPAIKNLIREAKTHQMYSIMEMSGNAGMITMDRNLADIYRGGYCSYEECLMRAVDKDNFVRFAKGAA